MQPAPHPAYSPTPCSPTPCLSMEPTFQGGDVCPQINSWRPGGEESRTELLPAYTGETGPQLGHSHCRTPTVALLPLPLLTHKHTRRKHPARNALTETDTHSLIHTYIHKQTVHLPAHISLEMQWVLVVQPGRKARVMPIQPENQRERNQNNTDWEALSVTDESKYHRSPTPLSPSLYTPLSHSVPPISRSFSLILLTGSLSLPLFLSFLSLPLFFPALSLTLSFSRSLSLSPPYLFTTRSFCVRAYFLCLSLTHSLSCF